MHSLLMQQIDSITIYNLLVENGFDSSIVNENGASILDFADKYLKNANQRLIINELYNKSIISNGSILEEDLNILKGFGTILNTKEYNTNPALQRDMELRKLYLELAKDKSNPILVGESGVGKTAIIEELVYRIKNNNVPTFLKSKIIYELNPYKLVSGKKYVGDFEQTFNQVMDICLKYNLILFIDEIHSIYGIGSSSKNDNDMASMLKYFIDRNDIKVIGTTTTDEYNKYFKDSALKRRFERIEIKEPNEQQLSIILDNIINNYANKYNIKLPNNLDSIINIIIDLTSYKHRRWDDRINNPSLAESVIENIFASARVENKQILCRKNIIEGINSSSRINDAAKKDALGNLGNISLTKEKQKCKVMPAPTNYK